MKNSIGHWIGFFSFALRCHQVPTNLLAIFLARILFSQLQEVFERIFAGTFGKLKMAQQQQF